MIGRRNLIRAATRVAAVPALLLIGGITVQAHDERVDRLAYPPPGQLVDVGGGQLIHVREWGHHSNGPTVVLDVSASMPSSEWAWVGPMLAGDGYRIVAYDRPGMAWSRGPWQPRDARHAADALGIALERAGIAPPYVVVAHSYGGFSARVFAATNRDDVVGLVLLDTTHERGGGESGFATYYRVRAWQAHAGFFALGPAPDSFWELPEDERAAANAVSVWTSHLDTSAEELEAWWTSVAQIEAAGSLGDMPLLVVSAIDTPEHVELQRDLTRLSTKSRFERLDVNHTGMLLNRDQAALTSAAIHRFVDSL